MCLISVEWQAGICPCEDETPFLQRVPFPPLPPPPIRRPRWRQTDAWCQNAGLNLTLHGAQRRAFRSPGKQPLHFIRPWNSEWKALASGCLAMRGSGEGVREGGEGEDGQNTPAQRRPLPPLLWLLGGLWDSWGAVHPAQEHFVVTGSLWAGWGGGGLERKTGVFSAQEGPWLLLINKQQGQLRVQKLKARRGRNSSLHGKDLPYRTSLESRKVFSKLLFPAGAGTLFAMKSVYGSVAFPT